MGYQRGLRDIIMLSDNFHATILVKFWGCYIVIYAFQLFYFWILS